MTSVNPAKQRESTEQKITSHNLGTPGVLEHPGVVRSICCPSKPAMMYAINSGISVPILVRCKKVCILSKSKLTNLCPLVGSGILYMLFGLHTLYLHNCIHMYSIYIAKIQ